MPLPKKVRIDFILSRIAEDGNEISEEELRKAMSEISDRYGGSTALETSEGRYINKEGVRKTEKILSFYVITRRQPSTLEQDLPNYKRELERRFNQEKILITYHDVTEVSWFAMPWLVGWLDWVPNAYVAIGFVARNGLMS
jgi:hypothetical protein